MDMVWLREGCGDFPTGCLIEIISAVYDEPEEILPTFFGIVKDLAIHPLRVHCFKTLTAVLAIVSRALCFCSLLSLLWSCCSPCSRAIHCCTLSATPTLCLQPLL